MSSIVGQISGIKENMMVKIYSYTRAMKSMKTQILVKALISREANPVQYYRREWF